MNVKLLILIIFCSTKIFGQTFTNTVTLQKDLRVQGETILGGVSKPVDGDAFIFYDTIYAPNIFGAGNMLSINGAGYIEAITIGGGTGTVTSIATTSPITGGTITTTGTLGIGGLTTFGTAGQLIKTNAGATGWEYFTPTYLTALTNGSGTTASGSAVDLGGTLTGSVTIDAAASNFQIINANLFQALNANDIALDAINTITLTSANDLYITAGTNLTLNSQVGRTILTGLDVNAGDFVTIGGGNELNKRTVAETKTDLSLNNVENTALSTWAGSTNLTTLGTIATGVWNGTAIAANKIAALTANRAVVTDGSGFISAATTTATQIGYLSAATGTTGTTTTNVVYSTSPTLVTPTLGTFAATDGTFSGTVTNYNSVATVNNGILSEVAVVNLTGQTAAIAATTAYTNGATDCYYLVCWNATVTTAATTSSTLGAFQVSYTNATDNVVKIFPTSAVNFITQTNANTTGAAIGGSFTIKAKASTAIQYIMGRSSGGATPMAYDLNITIVKL